MLQLHTSAVSLQAIGSYPSGKWLQPGEIDWLTLLISSEIVLGSNIGLGNCECPCRHLTLRETLVL